MVVQSVWSISWQSIIDKWGGTISMIDIMTVYKGQMTVVQSVWSISWQSIIDKWRWVQSVWSISWQSIRDNWGWYNQYDRYHDNLSGIIEGGMIDIILKLPNFFWTISESGQSHHWLGNEIVTYINSKVGGRIWRISVVTWISGLKTDTFTVHFINPSWNTLAHYSNLVIHSISTTSGLSREAGHSHETVYMYLYFHCV